MVYVEGTNRVRNRTWIAYVSLHQSVDISWRMPVYAASSLLTIYYDAYSQSATWKALLRILALPRTMLEEGINEAFRK